MISYESHKFAPDEPVPDWVTALEKPAKSCSILFVSQYSEQPLNKECQKAMNYLGYKVFVIKKKALFINTFLTRASSCKYDATHKLSSKDEGHCFWCEDQSQKMDLDIEDQGY
jgi:hypothetical protein